VDWTAAGPSIRRSVAAFRRYLPALGRYRALGRGRGSDPFGDPRTDLIAVARAPDFKRRDVALLAALAALVGWAGAGRNGLQQLLQGSWPDRPLAGPGRVLTASAETART